MIGNDFLENKGETMMLATTTQQEEKLRADSMGEKMNLLDDSSTRSEGPRRKSTPFPAKDQELYAQGGPLMARLVETKMLNHALTAVSCVDMYLDGKDNPKDNGTKDVTVVTHHHTVRTARGEREDASMRSSAPPALEGHFHPLHKNHKSGPLLLSRRSSRAISCLEQEGTKMERRLVKRKVLSHDLAKLSCVQLHYVEEYTVGASKQNSRFEAPQKEEEKKEEEEQHPHKDEARAVFVRKMRAEWVRAMREKGVSSRSARSLLTQQPPQRKNSGNSIQSEGRPRKQKTSMVRPKTESRLESFVRKTRAEWAAKKQSRSSRNVMRGKQRDSDDQSDGPQRKSTPFPNKNVEFNRRFFCGGPLMDQYLK